LLEAEFVVQACQLAIFILFCLLLLFYTLLSDAVHAPEPERMNVRAAAKWTW
jgi:hypothetical protein